MTTTAVPFAIIGPTPCRTPIVGARDPWFSQFRDRRNAAAACLDCPFLGRCGFNAVVLAATHGVWGGVSLPGTAPAELAAAYTTLLRQYEQRRGIELAGTDAPPVPPLPDSAALSRGAGRSTAA